ncbi:hypothetical protein LTR53_018594, partial [Teratosphaeriaceae sp. CCFEE 6253]
LTRIRSTVAGLFRLSTSVTPHCLRAALSASRMAKKTHEPRKSGGSPTPRERWIVRRLFQLTSLRRLTLRVWGMSRKPGICLFHQLSSRSRL